MLPRIFTIALTSSVALLIPVDAALFLYSRKTFPPPQNPVKLVVHQHAMLDAPRGFAANGDPIYSTGAEDQDVSVIRYASERCPHCREDMPRWRQLSDELKKDGYTPTITVPSSNDEYPASIDKQLVYVNMSWISRINFRATPIILIYDRKTAKQWAHMGTLSDDDIRRALTFVQADKAKGSQLKAEVAQ